jgi:hypothetical protein
MKRKLQIAANFSSKQLLICTHEAEWTPFQTHFVSENLVAPGIEPGPLDLYQELCQLDHRGGRTIKTDRNAEN